jgi:hypothetical protein
VRYLYQPLIPPIPAFFIAISALMTLRDKMTIIETTNDIGNGKTRDTIKTVTTETNNQARYFLPKGLSLDSLIDPLWPIYYLKQKTAHKSIKSKCYQVGVRAVCCNLI